MNRKKISFCVTYQNWFHQISQTLLQNLKDNEDYSSILEFVLVDFGAEDELQRWIEANFRDYLQDGYLKYLRTQEMKSRHMSIAKNTAHYHARGNILVNLDCDNYTGPNYAGFIQSFFENRGIKTILHQFSQKKGDGTCGKVAVHKKYFHKAGGYDESLAPAGYQDLDLIMRLKILGLEYFNISDIRYNQTIKNSKADCIKGCDTSLSWEEMENENRKQSDRNIKAGQLKANRGILE